jgi:SWI/SNF-related matrix-associated actin-dependent regulator 1 of chromatin subfamily A
MSYDICVRRYDELKEMPFNCIIFDEAHYLKSSKTKRTRVAKALVRDVPHVLFLSGTPFMNRPSELYPLLNMLDPIGFNNPYHFAARYCGAQFIDRVWVMPKDVLTNREELAERLGKYMLRRTKREVASELPDLTRVSIPIRVDNMAGYRRAVADFHKMRREQPKAGALVQLSALRHLVGLAKIDTGVELAESIMQNGEKVVLFAHHKDVVMGLVDGLKDYRVGVISGDTPTKERQRLVNVFLSYSHAGLRQDSPLQCMIITVAGAEGIDLYSANHIIFVEREWTPAREEQAEARLHRTGQKNPVTSHYLVVKDTVDEKFDEVVRAKRDVFGQVIRQDDILEEIMETIG